MRNGFAVKNNAPLIRLTQSHHHIKNGGLSSTIGAQQPHNFSGL
jgi:hypothetical protein